jgi:AcrR family transcriptional regulator
MARKYTLGKRAEQQAETRRRIAEAALELHGIHGPAQTTVSMIADRAGVQRHTYYAHFPDERSLLMACSGLDLERDPPPDPQPWRAIEDRGARLAVALDALYSWFARAPELRANVLRDAELHEATREVVAVRFRPVIAAYGAVLGDSFGPPQRAALALALSFHTWRTLTRDGGLSQAEAVAVMVRAVDCAGRADP